MNKFMKQAFKEAQRGINAGHGGPFGAVIVQKGEIIAKGHNHVIAKQDPTCHGEIEAIRKACKELGTFDLSGCELYTTGYPCPMCMGAILWANIDKVYYGCNTLDAEDIGFRDKIFEEKLNDKDTTFCVEMDRSECLALYREYKFKSNKELY